MADSLYDAPADRVDFEMVKAIVLEAEERCYFTESLTFEAKEKVHDKNVVRA
jgi:hypothetical protein